MSRDGALDRLFADRPIGAIEWGLDRIEALLRALGDPHEAFDTVHIAGTNGKGSTAAFTAALLAETGARVGLYTSPHLNDIRERFLVDGAPLDDIVLQEIAEEMLGLPETKPATYFECATALAFAAFREVGVSWGVVETGLGGRLDATNVLRPGVAVVTSIGLDHADMLGTTLEAIAAEKGGIFKRGVPAVIGEIPPPARPVLESAARRAEASSLSCLGEDAAVWDISASLDGTRFLYRSESAVGETDAGPRDVELRTGLVGRHQAHNAGVALLAVGAMGVELSDGASRSGIASARLPGRFEVLVEGGVTWVLDIAHNREGVDVVIQTLHEVDAPRPWVAVAGILADKPWSGMLGMLRIDTQAIILTQPRTAPGARRWDLDEVVGGRPGGSFDLRVVEDPPEALAVAREAARGGTVLVTGSAYTVGEARLLLAID